MSRLQSRHRPSKGRVANVTSAKAATWVTREISTTLEYDLTQEWAAFFHKAGFVGVRYEPRLSTGDQRAEAWFAEAGAYDLLPSEPVLGWRASIPTRSHVIIAKAEVID